MPRKQWNAEEKKYRRPNVNARRLFSLFEKRFENLKLKLTLLFREGMQIVSEYQRLTELKKAGYVARNTLDRVTQYGTGLKRIVDKP